MCLYASRNSGSKHLWEAIMCSKSRLVLPLLVLLLVYLTGCISRQEGVPEVEPLPTPIPEIYCETPRTEPHISRDVYLRSVQILELVEPGITRWDELDQLFGEPVSEDIWGLLEYDVYPDREWEWGGLAVCCHGDGPTIGWITLGLPMTVGQLVEAYGPPSRVFRNVPTPSMLPDGWEEEPEASNTYLLYDDDCCMEAVIMQELCEFPPDVPIDSIQLYLPGSPLQINIGSATIVEVEWPELATEQTD
jgi:hypothetical protein